MAQSSRNRDSPSDSLQRSEALLRLLVDQITDYAIFVLDVDGTVLSWNAGAERIKGYSASEIIGQHFSVFYPADAIQRRWPEHELREATTHGRFEDEGWRIREDGSRFWANVIITALRNEVYSCFAMPVAPDELRDAVAQALDADHWKNGIEVISALPNWIALRVSCRRMTADRMTRYVSELAGDVETPHRNDLATAFREVLLNAMEHGAGFDPDKVIEVAAVRTARAIVYYFKDPGPGFNPKAPGLVATDDDTLSHLTYREAEGKRAGGSGMLLTAKLVDEVHYNERGNEVFLVKHLDKLKEKKVTAPRGEGKKRVLPFAKAQTK